MPGDNADDEPDADSPGGFCADAPRPFVVTGGKTTTSTRLRVESTVLSTGQVCPTEVQPEHARALQLCVHPRSVAEVAALLGYAVSVTKVLLSDLLAVAAVTVRAAPAYGREDLPPLHVLEGVLNGLRAL